MRRERQLVTFKIEPNLERMWRAMGLTSEERDDEVRKLEDSLVSAYRDFVGDTGMIFEDLREQLRASQEEFKQTQHVFEDATVKLPSYANLSLREQIAITRRATADVESIYGPRLREFEDLHAQISELFDVLGITDRGDFEEVGQANLSSARLRQFYDRLRDLEAERQQRLALFESLRTGIERLAEELEEDVPDHINQVIDHKEITTDALRAMTTAVELLEEMKERRMKEFATLTEEVQGLYAVLAVDPSDRVQAKDQTLATLEVLRDEAAFLREQRTTRLPQVVQTFGTEVARLCKHLRIPMKDRPRYTGDDLEEEAQYLRQALEDLRKRQIEEQPIVSTIVQIEACRDAIAGKGTAGRRPGGRDKRGATEQLQKLEQKLLKMLVEFRTKNGYDFEAEGVNYRQEMEGRSQAPVEPRRKQALGKMMLMQKMSESRAQAGPPQTSRRSVMRT